MARPEPHRARKDASGIPAARVRAHPYNVEPQLATSGPLPTSQQWMFERKLDGIRILIHVSGGQVRLQSRNHQPYADRFPELTAALATATSEDFIADAEVVAHDGEATSFPLLQTRLGRAGTARRPPVQLYVFDLLYIAGHDLRAAPLSARKDVLAEMMSFHGPVRFTEHVLANPQRATSLLDDACRRGWEGLIGKDPASRYRSGRSPAWRKLPCLRADAFVVGGFTQPRGARSGFGALHVGYHDGSGDLRYAGKVGAGFDDQHLSMMRSYLDRIEMPSTPFADPPRDRDARWVQPLIVVEVVYIEWTASGRLRHPRFREVLADVAPEDVRLTEPG